MKTDDVYPELKLNEALMWDPRLEEFKGKTLTKQDAYKLLEMAAHQQLLVEQGVTDDPADSVFFHRLALRVMVAVLCRETR